MITILSYLSDVKFSPGAAGTDDEMFGEEETLSLSFFLQRQRAQSTSRDLPFLAHRHLDQGACGVSVTQTQTQMRYANTNQTSDTDTDIHSPSNWCLSQ